MTKLKTEVIPIALPQSEAAAALGMSLNTFKKLCKDENLLPVTLAGKSVFPVKALEAYVHNKLRQTYDLAGYKVPHYLEDLR